MENFDKVIRKKSIKGSTLKAYYAASGNSLSINGPFAFDENDITIAAIVSGINTTTDFYIDIIFPSFIKNISKLEYITQLPKETYIEGDVYVQYLPLTSTITVDTPPSNFDDNTSGPGSKDDFIIIDNNPFPYVTLAGLPTNTYRALVTELNPTINTQRIRYRFANRTALSYNSHYLNEFKIYTKEGEYNFEFNDSVLETKAWNSSRYTGKQLQASNINEFTDGDTTYGKTPVLQNYTRNIYLGSRVVGMNSSSIDDGTLTHFEGFSYITMHEYLTINDDLSITRRSIRGDDETNIKKKGFYRSFYHDFPINSEAEIKLFDETIDDNLNPSYNIFNNSGQLQKLLLVERHDTDNTGSGYGVVYSGSNQLFYATSSAQNDLGAEFTIYNKQLLIDNFFTGSLISTPPAWTGGSNPESAVEGP